jgi:glycosyltransferase involved in cell wall biosynthesis
MNVNPVVSIIVPIYKVEQYIERCARSLFEQTFKDIEIIFVNDSSPDNSIKILQNVIDEYPERSKQISIINHEANKGVAAARNTGLDIVSGEYILQVDSDDWIEGSMVEELYKAAKASDSDLVWTDFFVDFPNDTKNPIYRKQNVPTKVNDCVIGILSGSLHAGLWNKLMKRDNYLLNNLRFPEGINMSEDIVFSILFLLKTTKIIYLPKAFYHYMQNPDSITIARTRQSYDSEIKVAKILEGFLQKEIYGEYLMMYKARIKRNIFFSGIFSNDEFLNCFPESSSYIFIGLNVIDKTAIWLSLKKNYLLARIVLLFEPMYSKIKLSLRQLFSNILNIML